MLKPVYPFFLHSIYVRLVSPFSQFFTAVLDQYGIQALHLQPNSILLLSACVFFLVVDSSNVLLKAGKKVENFRNRSVFMSLEDANPRLEEPKGLSEKTSAWSLVKLSHPRVALVLECFSRDISTKRLTGGMIVQKFLPQRLAPLQAHSRPLWEYRSGDDELRLRSQDLPTEDLSRVVAILLGGDPSDLLGALGPLYRRDDQDGLVTAMHVFNERGILPAEGSGPVEVSSGNTSGEGNSREDRRRLPGERTFPSQVILLRKLEDDDATDAAPAGASSHPTRTSRGPVWTPRAMRSACVLASQKLGAEPSPTHPASVGRKPKAPGSPPP
ncbi:hypothetical protein D1007_14250 [Hordeum vulgare]|nr:hypothetical protein D1007_14250 [Hordeum vulgare]